MSERELDITKEIHSTLSIVRLPPFALEAHPEFREDLLALMQDGYGFTQDLESQAAFEYADEGVNKTVFLASKAGAIVGSLTIDTYKDSEDDTSIFLNHLRSVSEKSADACLPERVCSISGIVVHPSAQGKGIAKTLLSHFIDIMNPAVVVGQTKTPEAVMTRAKALLSHGFRTWYGMQEVTPIPQQQPPSVPHSDMYRTYLLFKGKHPGNYGEIYVPKEILLPAIANATMFPNPVRNAFATLAIAQQEENQLAQRENREERTAVFPLIAIRQSQESYEDFSEESVAQA